MRILFIADLANVNTTFIYVVCLHFCKLQFIFHVGDAQQFMIHAQCGIKVLDSIEEVYVYVACILIIFIANQ